MTRVVVLGVVIAVVAGAAALVADRLIKPAKTPIETLAERFPEGWESAPVVEYKKPEPPLPWLSAVPEISDTELVAALTALERLRPAPRPPQPADAVLSDVQIASMKERLELTAEQEPYWQPVEAALRLLVWERRNGSRPRLDPGALARVQEAVGPFGATLSPRQRSVIQALAHIAGLRLDLSATQ